MECIILCSDKFVFYRHFCWKYLFSPWWLHGKEQEFYKNHSFLISSTSSIQKQYSHSSICSQVHYRQMLYLQRDKHEIENEDEYYRYPMRME
jgi:hypothetical protein